LHKKAAIIRDVAVALLTIGLSAGASADEMPFFDEGIDYWRDKAKGASPDETPAAPLATTTAPEPNLNAESSKGAEAAKLGQLQKEEAAAAFDWKPFLDAKNKEFFREGDYTPPEPFMEIVRNPSDTNLRMWFAYIERKNALAARLAARMEEYARKNGTAMSSEARARVQTVASELPRTQARDYRELRFRMYFDSTCPHCKRMFQTLNQLQARGYFVEARQTDRDATHHLGSEVPIVAASRDELKKFGVSAVPLVLAGDLKDGKVYRLSGYQSVDDLLAHIGAKAGVAAP
jgi:glutaredoxin